MFRGEGARAISLLRSLGRPMESVKKKKHFTFRGVFQTPTPDRNVGRALVKWAKCAKRARQASLSVRVHLSVERIQTRPALSVGGDANLSVSALNRSGRKL